MKIYVCVKHVPDTVADIKLVGKAGFNDTGNFVTNPYDEYAIEQAVRIKESQAQAEVILVTVGKEGAGKMMRMALAVGADRGILVKTDAQFLDSIQTSQALKKAIEQDGSPDLIFTGKQSIDSEGMQTPYRLAAAFDMPVATDVVAFDLSDGKVTVEREIGGGTREVIELSMPCVIGATKGLNEPRHAKLPEIMKAKKKKVTQLDLSGLELESPPSSIDLIELQLAQERGQARMLAGDPSQMVEQLVDMLKKKEKLL